MDWVDKPQNYKDLHGILELLRGSHLNNFLLKTLKLGWVAFHSVTFQLKCLDFQSNQYKKLVPVLSRFCNWLWELEESTDFRKHGNSKIVQFFLLDVVTQVINVIDNGMG